MTSDALKRRLDTLRVKYMATLGDEADALQLDIDALQAGDTGAAERIARRAHRIAGTAGSYGLTPLSDAASVVEHAQGHEGVDSLLGCLREPTRKI